MPGARRIWRCSRRSLAQRLKTTGLGVTEPRLTPGWWARRPSRIASTGQFRAEAVDLLKQEGFQALERFCRRWGDVHDFAVVRRVAEAGHHPPGEMVIGPVIREALPELRPAIDMWRPT
jgi:hypothetical protein